MQYCKYRGTMVNAEDIYCAYCGRKIEQDADKSIKHKMIPIQKELKEKLCCELAYMGTLFWLPLVFCSKEKHAKFYANQGLWILIISVVSCWGIRILGIINDLLSGHVLGIIYGGIYSMAFMLFLLFMMYIFINCFKSAMCIHRNEKPLSIMFFEERAIIK